MHKTLIKYRLYQHAYGYLRWIASVYKKLVAILPVYTLSVAAASLAAQISLLLVFFLPLKIILLLGSPGVPRYFPAFFTDFDRNQLAIALGLATAGFYLLYLLLTRFIQVYCERGAGRLLQRSRKLHLFSDQEEITRQAYQRILDSTASLLFVGLALALITWIYTTLAGFLAGLLLVFVFGTAVILERSPGSGDWVAGNVPSLLNFLSAVFFLSAFGFIVIDFVLGGGVNIITAIIALLLSRQIASRLSAGIGHAVNLTRRKHQINALFFHGKALVSQPASQVEAFWSLLGEQERAAWLREVLRDKLNPSLEVVDSAWHQTGPPGVAGLDVKTKQSDTGETKWFFVKLFNVRQKAQAVHEATLLGGKWSRALPAPALLAVKAVEKYQCLVFETVPVRRPEQEEMVRRKHRLMARCWAVPTPEPVVHQYRRSKPLLADRLDERILYRLRIAANTKTQNRLVERFGENLESIRGVLSGMPLFVFNPDMTINNVRMDRNDDPILIHWGNWTLLPIGGGWPATTEQLASMERCLQVFASDNPRPVEVPRAHARLAALIFAFERCCLRENYVCAIDVLPDILSCLDGNAEPVAAVTAS